MTTTNATTANTTTSNSIVFSAARKFADTEYMMNDLTDDLFQDLGCSKYEDGEYMLQHQVLFKASLDQFPEDFIKQPSRHDRGYYRDIADSKVQFRITTDLQDGEVGILVTFTYRESYGRKTSESSIKPIRDLVTAEFEKHNYFELAKGMVTEEIMRAVQEKNNDLVQRAEYFFANSAADYADELLEGDDNQTHLFLKQQKEDLKAMLAKVEEQQAILRKDRLVQECEKDELPLANVLKPTFKKQLFDVAGLFKKSLFRR